MTMQTTEPTMTMTMHLQSPISELDQSKRFMGEKSTMEIRPNNILGSKECSNIQVKASLPRAKSESDFKNWEAYRNTWKKEGKELTDIMLGTNTDNIKGLKIRGQNILKKELEYCMSIPSEHRVLMVNHYLTESGEGEPSEKEEIIAEHYDKKYGF